MKATVDLVNFLLLCALIMVICMGAIISSVIREEKRIEREEFNRVLRNQMEEANRIAPELDRQMKEERERIIRESKANGVYPPPLHEAQPTDYSKLGPEK